MSSKPIGVFDSGLGGLTVVKELLKALPNEKIIYFGDTARVTYGAKSKATITKFSIESTLFLLGFDVKLIVIACNTASSLALPNLLKFIKVPIIDVIGPGATEAAKVTKTKRVGVIGTRATISSGEYIRQIKLLDNSIKVFSASCPLFVQLVEEGLLDDKISFDIAERYLAPIRAKDVDTMILGCTHYPLLKNVIGKSIGNSVRLIDSAKSVANQTKILLAKKNLLNIKPVKGQKCRFYVSDEPQRFVKIGQKFLGRKIDFVKKVSVSQ